MGLGTETNNSTPTLEVVSLLVATVVYTSNKMPKDDPETTALKKELTDLIAQAKVFRTHNMAFT